jgi:hypothetical protein
VVVAFTVAGLSVIVGVYVLLFAVISKATTLYEPSGIFSMMVLVLPGAVIVWLNLFGPVTVTSGVASAVNPVILTSSLPVAGCAGQAVMMLASAIRSSVETIRMVFLR